MLWLLSEAQTMSNVGWFDLATAALSEGIVVKLLDIAYKEHLGRRQRSQTAKRFVDENLDPLLKAGDELVGKIRSLADRDFKPLSESIFVSCEAKINSEHASVAYLFARFWARVEILRRQSLYVELSRDERGTKLMSLLNCLESQRIRIIDSIGQRAIGEALTYTTQTERLDCISYVNFVEKYEKVQRFREWLKPLLSVLSQAARVQKQRVLQYGVVVHALLDTLDEKHVVTSDRPSYPHKLSVKTKRSLKYRVFGKYCRFVADQGKFYGHA